MLANQETPNDTVMNARVSYLFVVKDQDQNQISESLVSEMSIQRCNIPSKRVAVYFLPAHSSVSCSVDVSTDELLEIAADEVQRLATRYPVFSVTYETHDWDSSFVLWPILHTGDIKNDDMDGSVEYDISWDYLLVRSASTEQFSRLINCVAFSLARYRSLSLAVTALEHYIDELVETLASPDDSKASVGASNQAERWLLMSEFAKVDPIKELKWGYEFQLLRDVFVSWNLDGLEKKAQESERIVAQLSSELSLRKESLYSEKIEIQGVEQNILTQRLSFVIGSLALLQVPTSILTIGQVLWKDDSREQWVNRPLYWIAITSGVVTVVVGCWLVFQHRRLIRQIRDRTKVRL